MPSGPRMLSRMYWPSRCPLTASTILPAQSMLMPYSQRSPGSNSRGRFSALSWQLMMPGTSIASMYLPISGFQMS